MPAPHGQGKFFMLNEVVRCEELASYHVSCTECHAHTYVHQRPASPSTDIKNRYNSSQSNNQNPSGGREEPNRRFHIEPELVTP
jgi:hypothetical protein